MVAAPVRDWLNAKSGPHRGSGSGSGLALVAVVAMLHDAGMELSDGKDGRGLRVTLRFPDGAALR
jgi:hypothetical protein